MCLQIISNSISNNTVPRVTRGPDLTIGGRSTSFGMVSLDLREKDPAAATFTALTQGVLFALVGCILGIVAAGLLVGRGQPIGWLIVFVGMSSGAVPLFRLLRDRRRSDHLDLFGIERPLRPNLEAAAVAVDRIERTAASAPDGPIAELLDENHSAALAHLRLMEADARAAGLASRSEGLRTVHHLEELAVASERLLGTALSTQPSVLNTLVERTALVEQALVEQAELLPTAGLDEPGRADRGATTDH